jgi:hypothetical protein
MTHLEYLEAYHEQTHAALTNFALIFARGDYDTLTTIVPAFQARMDALWAARVATAQREMNP